MNAKTESTLIGLAFLIITGIITALIPNPLFIRMIPANLLDYLFLISTSVSAGITWYLSKARCVNCNIGAGGIVSGIFAYSCPICSKILVAVFGVSGVLTYFEPIRPLLGVASFMIMIYLLFLLKEKTQTFKNIFHNQVKQEV